MAIKSINKPPHKPACLSYCSEHRSRNRTRIHGYGNCCDASRYCYSQYRVQTALSRHMPVRLKAVGNGPEQWSQFNGKTSPHLHQAWLTPDSPRTFALCVRCESASYICFTCMHEGGSRLNPLVLGLHSRNLECKNILAIEKASPRPVNLPSAGRPADGHRAPAIHIPSCGLIRVINTELVS